MRASQKGVSGANATTKASPFESEIPIAQTFGLYSVYFALPGAAAAGAAVRFRAVRTAADCPKPPLRSAVAPRTG